MKVAAIDDHLTSFLFLIHGLPHPQFYKKKSGVVVFQQSSRGENMMLEILANNDEETVNSSFFFFYLTSFDLHLKLISHSNHIFTVRFKED